MTGDEIAGIDALKKHFGTMFDKKDPSPLKYFLELKSLCQEELHLNKETMLWIYSRKLEILVLDLRILLSSDIIGFN